MAIIWHALIYYFAFVPVYLVLAAYSLRYYASFSHVSEKAIESFLWTVGSPLRIFYAEHSDYNLLTHDMSVTIPNYLKAQPHNFSSVRRGYLGIGVIIIIGSLVVGFTKQSEIIWKVEHIILFVAHGLTAFWAWRFGSKLSNIETT